MTHLIVQVGVQTRLLWLDNRYLHQITAVVTIFLMIHDLYLLLILPPDDISSASGFITLDEQAKQLGMIGHPGPLQKVNLSLQQNHK